LVANYLARGFASRAGLLLLLPLAVGIGVASYAGDCATFMRLVEADVKAMRKKLDAEKVPDMSYVVTLLEWSRWRFIIAVLGLSVLVLVCLIRMGLVQWLIDVFPNRGV
jgi:hypothetical protein